MEGYELWETTMIRGRRWVCQSPSRHIQGKMDSMLRMHHGSGVHLWLCRHAVNSRDFVRRAWFARNTGGKEAERGLRITTKGTIAVASQSARREGYQKGYQLFSLGPLAAIHHRDISIRTCFKHGKCDLRRCFEQMET